MAMYGEKIKQLRKKAGLSQAELALKIGISRPNISFWENSDYPPLEAIDRVCKTLQVDIVDFFNDRDSHSTIMLPEGIKEFVETLLLFDDETRNDLLEIFNTILQKYNRALLNQTESSRRDANIMMNISKQVLKKKESTAQTAGISLGDVFFDPWSVRFYLN
jgi:transcriptional regulator with XRE-family HTH domain